MDYFGIIFMFVKFQHVFQLTSSYAYLGPGVGGGVIAATLGIILAIFCCDIWVSVVFYKKAY